MEAQNERDNGIAMNEPINQRRLANLYVLRLLENGSRALQDVTTHKHIRTMSQLALIDPDKPDENNRRTWMLTYNGRRFIAANTNIRR